MIYKTINILLFFSSASLVCLDSPEVIAARLRRLRMHQEVADSSSSNLRQRPTLERRRRFHPGSPLPTSGTDFDEVPAIRGLAVRRPLRRSNPFIRQRFRYASTKRLDQIMFEGPER